MSSPGDAAELADAKGEPSAWLILQSSGSKYGDIEGVRYHYPLSIANARRIKAGDVVVIARPSREVAERRQLVAVARIGDVKDMEQGYRAADYDRYLQLANPARFDEVGGDPRDNPQHSISSAGWTMVSELLRREGHASLEDLPHVEPADIGFVPAVRIERGEGEGIVVTPPGPVPTFEWLMETTLWSQEALQDIIDALTGRSPQIVLAGPPGTSKTWVAKALAAYLTYGQPGAVRLVQFHPSYSYEQFIEGLRPIVRDGAVSFERVDGVVLDLVAGMADGDRRVLVIDEMNRANLPRVLGELMYLFEYRHEEIALQYSPSFALPAELLFVGTMNTADRSIRSIDVALRRRFDVFECRPDATILERYYNAPGRTNLLGNDLISGFVRLNEALEKQMDRHHTIGHTFFMAPSFDGAALHHAWDHKIGPLIEEYFFDQPDLAADFTVGQFWPSVK